MILLWILKSWLRKRNSKTLGVPLISTSRNNTRRISHPWVHLDRQSYLCQTCRQHTKAPICSRRVILNVIFQKWAVVILGMPVMALCLVISRIRRTRASSRSTSTRWTKKSIFSSSNFDFWTKIRGFHIDCQSRGKRRQPSPVRAKPTTQWHTQTATWETLEVIRAHRRKNSWRCLTAPKGPASTWASSLCSTGTRHLSIRKVQRQVRHTAEFLPRKRTYRWSGPVLIPKILSEVTIMLSARTITESSRSKPRSKPSDYSSCKNKPPGKVSNKTTTTSSCRRSSISSSKKFKNKKKL